jgi:hypothetical protein
MEYPLIDTGMDSPSFAPRMRNTESGAPYNPDAVPTGVDGILSGQPTRLPPTPKAPQPQDMQGVAFQLLAGMNPVLLGHAENVAKMANEKIRHGDILSHAARGIMPSERVQQIASVSSAPAPQVEDYDTQEAPMAPQGADFAPISPRDQQIAILNDYKRQRDGITLGESDPTAMNQAFDNVAGIMGNAPMAPQMQRPRLSDTEQLGSLIAGALGGGFEGAAQAQNAAFQGAGIRANRENQIAQQNFEAENSQWINKLRVAQQVANNQTNLYNQSENRNQRQVNNELRLLDGRIARTQQDIEDLDKQIQGFVDNTQKQVSEYTKLRGEMTDADMKHLLEVIDRQEKAQGLPKDYILERMMIAPVGWKSATVRNQERDDTFRDIKYKEDKVRIEALGKQKATKQNFDIAMGIYDRKLKELRNNGLVELNDINALSAERIRLSKEYGFNVNDFALPKVGMSWNRLAAENSQARQVDSGVMAQYWNQYEAITKAFDAESAVIKDVFDDAVKQRTELQSAFKKADEKFQESKSSSDAAALESARQAYSQYVATYQAAKQNHEARAQERGQMIQSLLDQKPTNNMFGGNPIQRGGSSSAPGKAASVRTSNPGAMWFGPLAKKWGATGKQNLNDGTGQGNNIAVFPNALNGFAAQFDLLNKNYTGKSLRQAITTWSGGNNVNEYLAHIQRETGMNPETFLSRELVAGEGGIQLVKAMAKHEAGGDYPVPEDVIRAAQPLGISGKPEGKQESTPSVIAGAGQTKNPRVKVVIDGKDNAPTPKPQPQVKPPGTPPNAGKGQVDKDGMVKGDKGRFKKRSQ